MLATIIVKVFVSAISIGLFAVSLVTWLNVRHDREIDRNYRGERDSRRILSYALHNVTPIAH